MPRSRFLWHLDPDGWPAERIDTLTGEHVPVFAGRLEESLHPQDGGRPMACCYPRVAGVVWGLGGCPASTPLAAPQPDCRRTDDSAILTPARAKDPRGEKGFDQRM